jgi:hypothetical protein
MQIKFNYTLSGDFTLPNGSEYVNGYFNVHDNGDVYSGRYYDSNSIKLNSISQYSPDYYKSKHFKDRYVFDVLELPNKLEKILIEPNEIVNSGMLNKKMQFLHENLIYTYSKMFMGSTDVPVENNTYTLCNLIGTNKFEWFNRLDPNIKTFGFGYLSSVPELLQYSEFDKIKRFVSIPFEDKTGVSFIAISDTHVIGLTSKLDSEGIISDQSILLYTDVIDNFSQETCKSLEDITFDGRYVYITDSKINGGGQVFKYDITTFVKNDPIFEGKRFLVEPIGGIGNIDNKNKFKGCTVINASSSELWIYDSGNNVIKIFDTNFVWRKTLKLPNTGKYTVIDIRYRKLNNSFYVLYQNSYDPANLQFGLFEYDSKYKLNGNYVFEDVLYEVTDKKFNRMSISEQDSNVFYVITDNTVYKKFFSRPEKTFAVFERDSLYPEDTFVWTLIDANWDELDDSKIWNYAEFFNLTVKTKDICINSNSGNKDDVYLLASGLISHLRERTDYISVLRNENLNYYNYERIKFEKNEYNQSFVFNKEFYKLFSNIIELKNFLKGRFYAEFNNYGDVVYKDYIYLIDEQMNLLNIEMDYNSFVNDNEKVEPNVLNRLFTKIYDFQIILLELTGVRLKNIKTWVDLEYNSNIYPID